jgi:hypothetical protein
MDRNGIPKVLRDLVMGHRTAGMEGVYAHVAPETRAALMAADERDWQASLQARFAMSPSSPVPVLDALLAPLREAASQQRSHLRSQ